MTDIVEFYKQTSQFTDLGKYKDEAIDLWENKCKGNLKKLCLYLLNATMHRVILQMALNGQNMQDYGDFSYIDFKTPMSEDDIFLTAVSMFAEIFRRDEKGFYIGRPAETRLNLTCRYRSVLTSAILKANGIACRSRAGWAKYVDENKYLDHWVNEYWNEKEKRWVMFDIDDLYDRDFQKLELYEKNKIAYQYLDIGRDQYIIAAEAWLNFRKDKNYLDKLQEGSLGIRSENVLQYLFFDFFAVMNFELNYTFKPMAYNKKVEDLSEKQLKEIDKLANLMLDVDKNFDKLKNLFENEPKFRMLLSSLVGPWNYEALIKKKGYKID